MNEAISKLNQLEGYLYTPAISGEWNRELTNRWGTPQLDVYPRTRFTYSDVPDCMKQQRRKWMTGHTQQTELRSKLEIFSKNDSAYRAAFHLT